MSDDRPEVLNERGSRYGSFEKNAVVTQRMYAAALSGENANKLPLVHKEAIHMICHKISRMVNGDYDYLDNVVDIIGYATLLKEHLEKQDNGN